MNILPSLIALLLALASGVIQAKEAANKQDVVIADLPLDIAVKQVRGDGRRLLVIFEDPNCIYCKRLDMDLADLTDVTIYSFVYPVLSGDSMNKAKAVWCSVDRKKAWSQLMLKGIAPAPARCDAGAIDKVVALGKKLGVRATPTIFLANGERISGAASSMVIEMAISSPRVLSFQAEQERTRSASASQP